MPARSRQRAGVTALPLTVGVLGAGMMAQGFDQPGAPRVLSMAHALHRSAAFAIGGFFDAREGRAAEAERRWGVPPSPRERDAWLDTGWDVVYIATPDAQHGPDVRAALTRRPRALLVEKPLSVDATEALALLEEADRRGVPIMVDYPRRWHSAVAQLAAMAARGELAVPESAFVAISGGAAHSLPHTIDLLHTIWGGGWRVSAGGEPTEALTVLRWRRDAHEFPMAVTQRSAHYAWEAHVYTSAGKLELSRSPEVLEWSTPAPHPDYRDFSVLTPQMRADMEGEPLLCRTLDALAAVVADPRTRALAMQRELESQQLTSAALRCFP